MVNETPKIKKVPEYIENKLEKIRQIIKESIPNNGEGLNLNRVGSFMVSQGLDTKKEIIVLLPEYIPTLQRLLEPIGLESAFKDNERAFYSPLLDIVFVKRDVDLEAVNGTIITEGFIVHELAHASSDYQRAIQRDQVVTVPRVGFAIPGEMRRGDFVEEGFADMLRAMYIEQNMSEDQKIKFIASIWGDSEKEISLNSAAVVSAPFTKFQFYMPLKYVVLNSSGVPETRSPSTAGTGLELLCKKEPRLFEVMLKARKNIEDLRQIPKIINNLSPDLYDELMQLQYTEQDFTRGVSLVVQKVYGGRMEINDNHEIL